MKGVIFTYLVTIVGVLGGLANPVYGAAAYFMLAILKPPALWFWEADRLFVRWSFYVAIATLVGWAIHGFGQRTHLSRVWLGVLCLVGFVAWQWVSALASRFSGPLLYYSAQKITNDMLMILVALTLITNFKHLRLFTWIILVGTGYVAYEMNVAYYDGWNRLYFNEFAEIDNNGMAMVFATAVPLAIGLGAYEKKLWLKGLAWVWIQFLVNAVFFSFSRTGMLGLLTMTAFIVWLMPNKRRTVWVMLAVIAGGLFLAGPSVQTRFFSIFVEREQLDASAASRYVTWYAAIRCMNDHPLYGVGPRCFALVAKDYGLASGQSVHNSFLQTGADIGIPGMVMLAGIYAGTMLAMFRNRKARVKTSPWYAYWMAMIFSGVAASVICSQFIGMERVEMPYMLCLLGLAAVRVALLEEPAAAGEAAMERMEAVEMSPGAVTVS